MIYTVTFNPSLDYVVLVDDFQSGKLNRITEELIFPGGKGLNVSTVLSNLGVENTALGFIAGYTGAELKRRLQNSNIITDFIEVSNGTTRINLKIRSNGGAETEVNGQGPQVLEEDLAKLMTRIHSLTQEDVLVVSGSVSKGVPQNIYADIVKLCKEKDIKVVVDAASALLWNAIEHEPFLIKPNKDELEDIFYRDIFTKEEVIFYAKELQNRGAKNVLVSLGVEGAVLVSEDGQVYEMDAPKGEVINSVGAGDSMVAGFLAEFLESGDYQKALKKGICAGSATAFSQGLATKEEVDKLMENE